LSLNDFEKITINAMKSAFLPYNQRCDIIYTILKPGYAKIRESVRSQRQGKHEGAPAFG
jgi:adenosine deaminase